MLHPIACSRVFLAICLLTCVATLASQTTPHSSQSKRSTPTQTAVQPPSSTPDASTTALNAERTATQADIARMRAILNQMRNNLGFVTNSTNPLKHQFELEIDMWQVLLDRMERRNQASQAATQPATKPVTEPAK